MSPDRPTGYRDLLNAVHRLDLQSRRAADRTLLAAIGVGRAQFLVLDLIAERSAAANPLSQQVIATELGLTRAAVSRQIIQAEEAGYLVVAQSKVSRRENAVDLTDAGRDLVRRGRRLRQQAAEQTLSAFADQDLAVTLRVLNQLVELLS